jgi:L-amino acid N-acyltransferase YncA
MMSHSERIVVRPALYTDVYGIWEIRNDPPVRSVSGSTEPIPLESHRGWLERKYFDSPTPDHCYVLEIEGQVAGYCRVDWDEAAAAYVVSIALGAAFQKRGLGHALLARALELFFIAQAAYPEVIARIKADNTTSISLFAKNGFVPCGDSCYRLQPPQNNLNR